MMSRELYSRCLGCVSLPGQVGDRCNCEFWPSRVPTYPHSRLAARSAAIPTYPPPALNSESARPPGGRSGTCLPLRGACLPRDHTYLPSRRFFQLQRSPTCLGKETQPSIVSRSSRGVIAPPSRDRAADRNSHPRFRGKTRFDGLAFS